MPLKDLLPHGQASFSEDFLKTITELIFKNIVKSNDRNEKVIDFIYPEQMEKIFEDYHITEEPLDLKKIIDDCKTVIDLSVKTGNYLYDLNLTDF